MEEEKIVEKNHETKDLRKSNSKKNVIIIILSFIIVILLALVLLYYFNGKGDKPIDNGGGNDTPPPTVAPVKNNDQITFVNRFGLTTSNQNIQIGNNTFDIRISNENGGDLYINDKMVSKKGINSLYVTDTFAFFTAVGQFDSTIEYAMDSNGNEIKLEAENYYLHDIHVENGEVIGTGMAISEALSENNTGEKLLEIKYENNTITIVPKN